MKLHKIGSKLVQNALTWSKRNRHMHMWVEYLHTQTHAYKYRQVYVIDTAFWSMQVLVASRSWTWVIRHLSTRTFPVQVVCSLCRDVVQYGDKPHHDQNKCTRRAVPCDFCQKGFEFVLLAEHQAHCVSRPWTCEACEYTGTILTRKHWREVRVVRTFYFSRLSVTQI